MTPPNHHQFRLAFLLGVNIKADTERVAAARLEDAVAPAIYPGQQTRPATDRQIAFGDSLGLDLTDDSLRVASARIDQELRARNRKAISDLDLKPGDRVVRRECIEINGTIHNIDREYVVSSVDDNDRVWFKGGNGHGAWPTQFEKLTQEPTNQRLQLTGNARDRKQSHVGPLFAVRPIGDVSIATDKSGADGLER